MALELGGYGIYFYEKYNFHNDDKVIVQENNIITKEDNIIEEEKNMPQYVEIKGEVVNPGVYPISENTIVNDIVLLAGGFTKNAYTKNINLSKKLNNETVIYVYTKYEYSKLNEKEVKTEIVFQECNCPSVDISACLDNGSSVIESNNEKPTSTKPSVESSSEIEKEEVKEEITSLVNINTASKDVLMTLNGIGESKANSIIDYRTNTGLFKTIEDIKLVSGISDKIYENIKDFITV